MRVHVTHRPDKLSPKHRWPGCELRFPKRPARHIRERLHDDGWRVSRSKPHFWYAYLREYRKPLLEALVALGDNIPEDTETRLAKKPAKKGRRRRRAG